MKTSELTGAALDWAVSVCEHNVGWEPEGEDRDYYSTDWAQGGPIIEREYITSRPVFHAERTESGSDVYRQDGWAAHVEPKAFWVTIRPFTGPTPLIAAMRCYVASKLGDNIEIPVELTK